MGFVIVIAVLFLGGWILLATFRRFSSHHVGIAWWLVFCGVAAFGVAIGYRLAFDFEYNVSPHLRVASFPIPVSAFHFEHGQWVDFPSPDVFAYSAAFTNVIAVTAFVVLPLLLVSMFCHRNGKGTQQTAKRPPGKDLRWPAGERRPGE
jgi:hypothetical protein